MFFKAKGELPIQHNWADQPGYEGGVAETSSIAVEIPEGEYADTVKRLKKAGVQLFKEKPEWRMNSYWGLNVLDPMGTTVEVYSIPKEKPRVTEWT